jgi:ubiquitin-conjugating enzyme E2 J1
MQGGEALSAIGALDYSKEERKRLARLSRDWVCPTCGEKNSDLMGQNETSKTDEAAKEPSESPGASPEGEQKPIDSARPEEEVKTPPSVAIPQAPPDPQPQPRDAGAPTSSASSTSIRIAIPTPTPTRTTPQANLHTRRAIPTPRPVPIWFDAAIFLLVTLLVVLVARRLA